MSGQRVVSGAHVGSLGRPQRRGAKRPHPTGRPYDQQRWNRLTERGAAVAAGAVVACLVGVAASAEPVKDWMCEQDRADELAAMRRQADVLFGEESTVVWVSAGCGAGSEERGPHRRSSWS